jgi:tetratricopeptide (TPR) repeat protein
MVYSDSLGNSTSATSSLAVLHLETALDCFLHFRGSMLLELNAALESDPKNALAWALRAYLGVLGTEPLDAMAAREAFFKASPSSFLPREQGHLAAAQALLAGDFWQAGRLLEEVSIAYPRDLLALAVGHQIDFFTGNSRMLRDRPAQVLGAWSEVDKNYANVLGMLAFGFEEMNQHDRAFELGFEAVERNPQDVWALHAVGHTFEETGRFLEGMKYYDARANNWTVGNYFIIHNWWHYALFALEAGDMNRVLEIFDVVLFNADNGGLALQLLDASALLWRLRLEGHRQEARFSRLAQKWLHRLEPAYYAFNDMHAVMALVGAGWFEAAQTLIKSRETWLETKPLGSINNVSMTKEIGLPICKAILAFEHGQFETVIALLYPIRRRIHEFGGSHAQRDVVLKTLIEAALRAKKFDLAQAMLSERIAVRPKSPYNWLKYADALEGIGLETKAVLARVSAQGLLP